LFKLVLRNAPVFINIDLAVLEGTESTRTNVACFVGAATVAVADVAGFSCSVFVGVYGAF